MTPKYLVSEDRVIGTLFTKISQSCLNLYDKQLLRISDLSFHISHIVHRRAPSSISECHLILSSTSSSEMTLFLISLLGPPSLSPSLYPHLISAIILIILLSISTADMTIPLKSTPPHSHCYQLSWHHPLCSHLIPFLSSLCYNIWRSTLISVAQILSSCL